MSALDGRHVLVVGVREPEGRALAVALAEAGAMVSVTTRRAELAEEVTANSILNECWTFGREGRALTLDLGDPPAVAAALDDLEASLAPLAALVTPLPPDAAPDAIASAAAERMAARGTGVVVLPVGAYGGDGVRALGEALDGEWGARGVVVVAADADGDLVRAVVEALV